MLYFQPNILPSTIAVIGAGGTGSRLIPPLAQFIKTVPWLNDLATPKILLFDDDEVETNNLTRQNFISPDVGRPKAEVLAQRYSRAYDIDIQPHLFRFGLNADTETLLGNEQVSVFISCVDSVAARVELIQAVGVFSGHALRKPLIIDSGNEDDFGQVSVFHPVLPHGIYSRAFRIGGNNDAMTFWENFPERDVEQTEIEYIPCPFQSYGERTESERSCADLDQTLAVNNMMASGIMAMFQNITFRKPIYKKTVYYRLDGDNFSENIMPQDMLDSFSLNNYLQGVHSSEEREEEEEEKSKRVEYNSILDRFQRLASMAATTYSFNVSRAREVFGSVEDMVAHFAQNKFISPDSQENLAQLYFSQVEETSGRTEILSKIISYYEGTDSQPQQATSALERLLNPRDPVSVEEGREYIFRNYPEVVVASHNGYSVNLEEDPILGPIVEHIYPGEARGRERLIDEFQTAIDLPLDEALAYCAAVDDEVRDLCRQLYENRSALDRRSDLSDLSRPSRVEISCKGVSLYPETITSFANAVVGIVNCQRSQDQGFMLRMNPGGHAAFPLRSPTNDYRVGLRTDWVTENIIGGPITQAAVR